MEFVIRFFSGERFLDHRANGGTAVLVRSVWITAWIYLLALLASEITKDGAVLAFDFAALVKAVNGTLPWFGAILAATYAALYARFASQWSYLAGLYNQIMCAQIGAADSAEGGAVANWKAAFVEDAEDLHLLRKPMYAQLAADMLRDDAVRRAFMGGAIEGEIRLQRIEQLIAEAIRRGANEERRKHAIWRKRRRKVKGANPSGAETMDSGDVAADLASGG